MIRTSPAAIASSALLRTLAGCEPDTIATGRCSGWNHWQKFRQCCSASSSVGAMSTACMPEPAARAAAAAATIVLPQLKMQRMEPLAEVSPVLFGEQFGGRHEHRLHA